jgi:L-alanine-DL-glutamate epimerase-like enolase superfamily enzyme
MLITECDVRPCALRKEDPTWATSLHANPLAEGFIVRIATKSGHYGFGYASAVPHMGSVVPVLKAELEFFASSLIGKNAQDMESIGLMLDKRVSGAPFSKSAINCALYDLNARALGVPLATLLGGAVRDSIPVIRILALKQPEEMAPQAAKLVAQGYRYLKIKVDGHVDLDVARVAAIRKAVGDDVHLTIDANQAYSVKDAIVALRRMADHGLDLAEQPVHVDDLDGLAQVTRAVPVTVEADESAGSLQDVYHLVRHRIVDAISLKIPKLGGLRNAVAAARICEAGGIRYRLGAAVGSRVLVATALHLACALPGVDYACELGEYERLLDDPFEGLEIADGSLRLPTTPGLGVRERQPPVRAAS